MLSPSRSLYGVRSSHAAWLPVLTLGVLFLLGSRSASAQVTTSYLGSACQPAEVLWTTDWTFPMDGGVQAKSTGNGGWVICPITKFTSGPGIDWGDELADITVSLNNHSVATGMYCQAVVYSSNTPSTSSGETNVQYWGWAQTATADVEIDWSDGIEGSGYWQDTSWYYAQLECKLKPGEEVVSYEVTENGSTTGQVISPVSAGCSAGSTSNNHFQVNPGDTLESGYDWAEPVGWAEADGGDPVKYDCGTPLSFYQYSVVPTINPDSAWEWAFNTSGFGSPASWTCTYGTGSPTPVTGPAHQVFPGSSGAGPAAVFPSSTYAVLSANEDAKFTGEGEWLVTSTTFDVFFNQCTTDGDWGLISYRASN